MLKKIMVSIIILGSLSGCASTPFTVTFPDEKSMTMNGKIPSAFEVSHNSTEGVGVGEVKKSYNLRRENPLKIFPSFNASLINMGAAVSKE